MTTMWQNDEGHYEDGCGCLYGLLVEINGTKRFKVAYKSTDCPRHAFMPVPERRRKPQDTESNRTP